MSTRAVRHHVCLSLPAQLGPTVELVGALGVASWIALAASAWRCITAMLFSRQAARPARVGLEIGTADPLSAGVPCGGQAAGGGPP